MSGKVRNQPKTQFLVKNGSGSIEEDEEKWTQYTAKTENGQKGFDSVKKKHNDHNCWGVGLGGVWSDLRFSSV